MHFISFGGFVCLGFFLSLQGSCDLQCILKDSAKYTCSAKILHILADIM